VAAGMTKSSVSIKQIVVHKEVQQSLAILVPSTYAIPPHVGMEATVKIKFRPFSEFCIKIPKDPEFITCGYIHC